MAPQRAIGWPQGGGTVYGERRPLLTFKLRAERKRESICIGRGDWKVANVKNGTKEKKTQGSESGEIWVGKAFSKVVVLASKDSRAVQGLSSLPPQARRSRYLNYLLAPSTSFYTDEMQLRHAGWDCESGHVEDFHVAQTQDYHSSTRVVPDANGGKEEEDDSVLGVVPRHAPNSTGRSAQSAASAGL
ncbi:hypothetical protein H4582DRAFT_2053875 [Lactarius indigo]|nr:hypothetical protein H4582DRAFT_2053875 [Lactarius indigo]